MLGKDQILFRKGPIALYYESLSGTWTLDPFRVFLSFRVGHCFRAYDSGRQGFRI